MTLKSRLKLCDGKLGVYKDILFDHAGNSLEVKFKLIKAIAQKDDEDFYVGYSIDSVGLNDFADGSIVRNEVDGNKVVAIRQKEKYDFRRTVFYHFPYSKYYYDILDNNACCLLLDKTRDSVEQGCCNMKEVHDCRELVGIKVKTKKDNRRR